MSRHFSRIIPTLLAGSFLLFGSSAMAAKPGGAGGGEQGQWKKQSVDYIQGKKGKSEDSPDTRREEYRQEAREEKQKRHDDMSDKGSREQQELREREEKREQLQERKTEQDRSETGKGSMQGQESREEHSRKWWRFWD